MEADNRVDQRWRTAEQIENAASIMYEVNVYSNKIPTKKSEAKTIMAMVDEHFAKMGFRRAFLNQIPNLNNSSIYRIVARYEGLAIPNDDGNIYIHSN